MDYFKDTLIAGSSGTSLVTAAVIFESAVELGASEDLPGSCSLAR